MDQQQQQQTQGRGAGSGYNTPSDQVLLIKGKSCIEPVSLPQLQQFFTNIDAAVEREYANFQVQHFDFPLNDSLTKTFEADQIIVRLNAFMMYDTLPGSANQQGESTYYYTDMYINVNRTHSSVDLANNICSAIGSLEYDQDQWNLHWRAWLNGVTYDASAQKLCMTLSLPSEYPSFDEATQYYPKRMIIQLTGRQTDRQGELAAAIFGGKVLTDDTEGNGWVSEFDTGNTYWFLRQIEEAALETPTSAASFAQQLQIYSQRPTRMFVDPYVFIHGSPEHSIWTTQGSASAIMTVQPRNRPPGVITSAQAFLGSQTHSTKTSLASLRSMNLKLTDSQGRVMLLDEEYVIKIVIQFIKS